MTDIRMVEARRVRALEDHKLEIVFDDDSFGVLDLRDFVNLGPVTEPLRDPDFFRRVFIEMGTPTWPNGCSVDPINAQMKIEAAGMLRRANAAA